MPSTVTNSSKPGFFFQKDIRLGLNFIDKVSSNIDTFDFSSLYTSAYNQLIGDIKTLEKSHNIDLDPSWEKDLTRDFRSLLKTLDLVFSDLKKKKSNLLEGDKLNYSKVRRFVLGNTGRNRVFNDLLNKTRYTGITFENIFYDILLLRALVFKEFTLSLVQGDFSDHDFDAAQIYSFVLKTFANIERDSFSNFLLNTLWSCISKLADIRSIKAKGASDCYWSFLFMLNSVNVKSNMVSDVRESLSYLNLDKEHILYTFFNAGPSYFRKLNITDYSDIDEDVVERLDSKTSVSTRYTQPFDYYLLLCICSSENVKKVILTYLVSLYESLSDASIKEFISKTLIPQVDDFSPSNSINRKLKAISDEIVVSLFGSVENMDPTFAIPFPAVFQTSTEPSQNVSKHRQEKSLSLVEDYNTLGPLDYVISRLQVDREDRNTVDMVSLILECLDEVNALKKKVN